MFENKFAERWFKDKYPDVDLEESDSFDANGTKYMADGLEIFALIMVAPTVFVLRWAPHLARISVLFNALHWVFGAYMTYVFVGDFNVDVQLKEKRSVMTVFCVLVYRKGYRTCKMHVFCEFGV